MVSKSAWLLVSILACMRAAAAGDFYVSPAGASTNSGSINSPWDLQTALNHPAAVKPGDTIWLRGGVYAGSFRSNLVGAAGAPIVVKGYPGERAILDGHHASARSSGRLLAVYGAHTWFWGFEVTSSDPNPPVNASGPNNPEGITIYDSHHIKLINLVVHDMPGQGIAFWSENTDSEIEGCIIYHNGMNGWDHGIYLQNRTGVKRLQDNIIFTQASHGVHAYGSTVAYLDNIQLEGNTVFNSGYLSGASGRNILVGGGRIATNPVLKSNYTYFTGSDNNSNIGYSSGASGAQISGNYFIAGNVALRLNLISGTFTGNFLTGETDPADMATRWPSNTYLPARPTSGSHVFVRPNPHEAGRAHVTIYNWGRLSSVPVNLSAGGLAHGTPFEIRDVQNYFGAPAMTGTYAGGDVVIPMTGTVTAAPLRFPNPAHTPSEFGVFVVVPLGTPPAPPPPSGGGAAAQATISGKGGGGCGLLGLEAALAAAAALLRRRARGS
jgi:hypothetical protein